MNWYQELRMKELTEKCKAGEELTEREVAEVAVLLKPVIDHVKGIWEQLALEIREHEEQVNEQMESDQNA